MDENTKAGPVAAPSITPDSFPLTLDEACQRLSVTDRRIELIAAFHHTETAAGRLRDTEEAYRTRLAAFASSPA